MKEQEPIIVKKEEMSYPRSGEKTTMPDAAAPEQQQLTEEQRFALLRKLKEEEKKKKKKDEETEAQRGLWLFLKNKIFPPKKEPPKDPAASKKGEKGEKPKLDPKQYFDQAPVELRRPIDEFCQAAQGLDLKKLDTTFLTYHYLALRREAQRNGVSGDKIKAFLGKIQREIETREGEVKVQTLEQKADEMAAKVVPTGSIADESFKQSWEIAVRSGWATEEERDVKMTLGMSPDIKAQQDGGGEAPKTYPDLPVTGDSAIDSIANELNSGWPGPRNEFRRDQSKVEAQIQRVQRLIDEERVNRAGKINVEAGGRLINALEGWQRTAREEERKVREKMEEEREKRGSFYDERKITAENKEMLNRQVDAMLRGEPNAREEIDKLFNRMFDQADSNPLEDFSHALGSAGQQERHHWVIALNDLRDMASKYRDVDPTKMDKINELIMRYSNEYKLRELLHNTYYIVETGGDPKNFVEYSSQFLSQYLDLLLSESPEVEVAYRVREQVLYQIKRENGGTFPPEAIEFTPKEIVREAPPGSGNFVRETVFQSEFEERTRKLFIKTIMATGIWGEKSLPTWRIDRALSTSRGLGMVLLRWPEIVAESTIQAAPGTNEAAASIPWEKLSWELNPLDHKIKRYAIAREMRTILYAAANRKKKGMFDFWDQDELKQSVGLDAITALGNLDRGQRMVDLRNLSRIGGWATYSGWRAWISALEREGGDVPLALAQLQQGLGRNPGLAVKLLFNRYKNNDLGLDKKEFIKKHGERTGGAGWRHGIGENSEEILEEWQGIEKGLKKGDKHVERWQQADMETWKNTAKRIPHVVLRILTDDANKLFSKEETNALLKEIFLDEYRNWGAAGYNDFKKIYTQTETDLTLAKEFSMKRRREAREKFIKDHPEKNPGSHPEAKNYFDEGDDEVTDVDLRKVIEATSEDGDVEKRLERALKLKGKVQGLMENKDLQKKLFNKMKSREFAYALTTEDLPLGEFRFVQAGARGIVTRRNNDFMQEIQANAATEELLKQYNIYGTPEDVTNQLTKIFKLAEVHDYDRALELIEFLAKGVIRMNSIDAKYKIPIIGGIQSTADFLLSKRGKSYSQTAYGPTAMAWDSDDIYVFTEQLRKNIFIGHAGEDILERIRKETGGTIWKALGKKSKMAFYLFMLFFSYEMMQKLIKGK